MVSESIAVGSLVVAIAGVWINGYNSRARLKEQQIAAENRMTAIETKVGTMWKVMELKLVEMLHHPDPKYSRADHLLEQYTKGCLTHDERQQLIHLMRERSRDPEVERYERVASLGLLVLLEGEDPLSRRITDNVAGPPIIDLLHPGRTARAIANLVNWADRVREHYAKRSSP